MKKIYINFSILCMILFFIGSTLSASPISLVQSNTSNTKDSLVLKHNFNNSTRTIFTGKKLKIWTQNQKPQKGYFKSSNGKSLIITKDNIDVEIMINDIHKLKVFGDLFNSIEAGLLTIIGTGSFVFGSYLTLVVASGLGEISSSALSITIPMMAAGVGLIVLGAHIYARKFNLKKRWSIVIGN